MFSKRVTSGVAVCGKVNWQDNLADLDRLRCYSINVRHLIFRVQNSGKWFDFVVFKCFKCLMCKYVSLSPNHGMPESR